MPVGSRNGEDLAVEVDTRPIHLDRRSVGGQRARWRSEVSLESRTGDVDGALDLRRQVESDLAAIAGGRVDDAGRGDDDDGDMGVEARGDRGGRRGSRCRGPVARRFAERRDQDRKDREGRDERERDEGVSQGGRIVGRFRGSRFAGGFVGGRSHREREVVFEGLHVDGSLQRLEHEQKALGLRESLGEGLRLLAPSHGAPLEPSNPLAQLLATRAGREERIAVRHGSSVAQNVGLRVCPRRIVLEMISLTPAAKEERVTVANLMQLYSHDWSELGPLDVGDDGRFADYPLDAYWEEDGHHPLLLRVEGKLAGFALILERSRLTGTRGVFDMAEFFVMRRYRRQGVGVAAASAAFDRFPGPWEVRQRRENVAATAFWRRVIARYTGGAFHEVDWENATWTGPVQTFTTGPR